jgi:CheY-like chemotaxis protein
MRERPARVLVVEDDELLRETIGEVIADVGHEVRLAANGHEALAQIADWPVELIVLDLMMPLMDAYEFRVRQRREALAPDPKVLVLSASPDVEEAAGKLEATAWLSKPFNLGVMLEVVDRLLDPAPA